MSPGYRKNNPTKKIDPQRFGVIFLVRTRSIWRGTIGGPICDDLVYGFLIISSSQCDSFRAVPDAEKTGTACLHDKPAKEQIVAAYLCVFEVNDPDGK